MNAEPRVVLVSGGSRGLGAALVGDLLRCGHRVATFSRTRSASLEALALEDPAEQRLLWRAVDAAHPEQLRRFVAEAARRFGRIDALVNNAAMGVEGLLLLTSDDDVQRCLSLNLQSVIHLTRACAKVMLPRGSGAIVNVASITGERGFAGLSVYSAAKAGLAGFSRSRASSASSSVNATSACAPTRSKPCTVFTRSPSRWGMPLSVGRSSGRASAETGSTAAPPGPRARSSAEVA